MNVDPTRLIAQITQQIQQVSGVEAVVLGGSRARQTAGPDSDIDLGIYYQPERPPDLTALNNIATALDDQHRPDLLTAFSGWGPWINGGGWLKVSDMAVDFLYRDLAKVKQVITDCLSGRVEVAYQPGHPHAFTSAIYLAEVALCQPLTDPHGTLSQLKQRVSPYPRALQKALIERFFWEAEFSINNARKAARRGDAAYVTGCCFRCTACLLQTLFALNRQYWMNEKGALALAARFDRAPADLQTRMHAVTALLGPDPGSLNTGLDILQDLNREVSLLLAA